MTQGDKIASRRILGYSISPGAARHYAASVLAHIDQVRSGAQQGAYLACLNPHSYVVATRSKSFERALKAAQWLLADGVGIVLASKVLRQSLPGRVTGFDFFEALSSTMNARGGYRVFFLGSSEETLRQIRARMRACYPNVVVAGSYSPPYKDEFSEQDIESMVSAISAASPDVLWVGMTAPKQELWISQHLGATGVPFAAAIGAVFDFFVGNVRRSHPIFQKVGLEWLPRLLQEPRRLWRRTIVSGPIFVAAVVKDVISPRNRHPEM